MTYSGSCLCGAVAFEVDAFLGKAGHCHCSMCQKHTGAAFGTYASVNKESFRWLAGEENLKQYKAENGTTRTFCRNCGSSLTFHSKQPTNLIEVALAAMDGDIPVQPDYHIYVDSKVSWFEPGDNLHKFPSGRDS